MGSSNSRPTVVPVDSNGLEISKQTLDFNLRDEPCPVNVPVFDEVTFKNIGPQKMKFKFDPVIPSTCHLTFSPVSGTLDLNKSKRVKVKFVVTAPVNLNFKVTLRIIGGAPLFINLRIACESGVFGVDPTTLEMTEDQGHRVPIILAQMKNIVLDNGGIKNEGIFRLAGEQTEIARIKDLMNRKLFDYNTKDVNTIANLIKIWFRDLPVPILNALPDNSIMNCSDVNECIANYQNLPEPQKSLLGWLLDFLAVVASNSEVNKMTAQNLAIVIAPNLYDISTPNPMEGLILSQKCAQFLNHILNSHIQGLC